MICFDFKDLDFRLKFNEHFVRLKKGEKKKSINSQCNEQRLDLHYPPLVRSLRVCTEIKKKEIKTMSVMREIKRM